MSSVKLILDIGLEFFPAGRAFTAGTGLSSFLLNGKLGTDR
jgi:hypothetical protein